MVQADAQMELTGKQLFALVDAHPIALNMLMLKEFGPEYLGWEPETCWDEVRLTWGVNIAEVNKQKIQAVRSIYIADEVLQEWEQFQCVVNGLLGVAPRPDIMQRPAPGRLHVALDIIAHIRDMGTVKDEIYKYCAAVLMDFGVAYGPGRLVPANKYLNAGVSAEDMEHIKTLVQRNATPTSITSNTLVATQAMKSLSIKDFALSVERILAVQLQQLGF